ncbi:MAG: ATP-binding protein [Archaeoglobales archaeon]|nr:ATP-binding protein [Archaeoglobales archaeon]
MKCRCGKEAIVYLRYVKRPLCNDCFSNYYVSSVSKTIKRFGILKKDEKILAAVSGGKDSASMALVLKKLGYDFEMLYIDLGIPEYSKDCKKEVEKLSELIDVPLSVVELKNYGFTIADVKKRPCSACGTAKRYIMNSFARHKFQVVATGHTAEDIASFFLKNTASGASEWSDKLLPRTDPFDEKVVAKAKPLILMSEKENMIYSITNCLPFKNSECPYAPEQTWKEIVYDIERKKPGFTKYFVRGLISKTKGLGDVKYCLECGEVSSAELCSFCRLRKKFAKK